jgi:hypothetical protein
MRSRSALFAAVSFARRAADAALASADCSSAPAFASAERSCAFAFNCCSCAAARFASIVIRFCATILAASAFSVDRTRAFFF